MFKKDSSLLNFSNDFDILYLYKHIKTDPSLLNEFQKIEISKHELAKVCLEIIESEILEEIGEIFYDKEMNEMIEKMIHIDTKNNGNSNNDDSNCNDNGNTNNGSINNDDSNISNITNNNVDEKFFCKNLNIILKPLINIFNKVIVDLVYYVYKKTGINHFEFLFENFKSTEHKIELHLLFAKGLKMKSFDFTDFKDYLDLNEDSKSKVTFIDHKINDHKIDTDEIDPIHLIHNEIDPNHKINADEIDPPYKSLNHNNHLEKAKSLLLENSFPFRFAINALSTFLSLKFDQEIFAKFLTYRFESKAFISALKKIQNTPFFFYENANIESLLIEIPKEQIDPYNIFNIENSIKNNGISYKFPVNSYTLREFLKYCHIHFTEIQSSYYFQSEYLLIARGLKYFVKEYFNNEKVIGLFWIFLQLMECKDYEILRDVKNILFSDLLLYLESFYKKNQRIQESLYKKSVDDSCFIDYKCFRLKILKYPLNESMRTFPSFDNEENELIDAYLNFEMYKEEDKRLSDLLLDEFLEMHGISQSKINEMIEEMLIENSKETGIKIYLLENIKLIERCFEFKEALSVEEETKGLDDTKKLDDGKDDTKILDDVIQSNTSLQSKIESDTLKKIIENLKTFHKLDWRYKKAFLNKIDLFEKYGVEKELIKNEFKKDKVFSIREMVEKDSSK